MRETIYDGVRVTPIADFCFFPKQTTLQKIIAFYGFDNFVALKQKYQDFRFNNIRLAEPDWLEQLPNPMRSYLNYEFEFNNLNFFKIVNYLPYTKISYGCLEGGLVHHLHDVFNLHRLYNVRQLGFLTMPLKSNVARLMFPHSRGVHHLDTAAIGLNIIRNNHELQESMHVLEAAFCSHDALTPAGSDTTKFIDSKKFDEEMNFNMLFSKPGWKQIRNIYDIEEELLYETVCGKGILGHVLDIADKIAYTARDISCFIGGNIDDEYRSGELELFHEARKIIKENPDFCSLWNDVKIYNGDVVFTNPLALARFLKIRAIATAELYKKDHARVIENVLARKLIKIPYDAGEISANDLLSWNDQMLEEFLRKKYGISFFILFFDHSQYLEFPTQQARKEFIANSIPENMLAIIDDFAPNAHSGTQKFKVLQNGKVQIFAEACPDISREIDLILLGNNSNSKKFPLYLVSQKDLRIENSVWKEIKEAK